MHAARSIPIIATARHVRLQQTHVEALFGAGRQLTRIGPLALPSVFACAEVVTVRGVDGALEDVRVVGPTVRHTIVRVSPRDLPALGAPTEPVPRTLAESHGCTLEGPAGTVVLAEGLVTPRRVLSIDPTLAQERGLADGASVTLTLRGERGRDIPDVRVQFSHGALHLSLDIDDALATEAWAHSATWATAQAHAPD